MCLLDTNVTSTKIPHPVKVRAQFLKTKLLTQKCKQTKPKQNWGLKIATFVTMKLQGNIIVYTAIKT